MILAVVQVKRACLWDVFADCTDGRHCLTPFLELLLLSSLGAVMAVGLKTRFLTWFDWVAFAGARLVRVSAHGTTWHVVGKRLNQDIEKRISS